MQSTITAAKNTPSATTIKTSFALMASPLPFDDIRNRPTGIPFDRETTVRDKAYQPFLLREEKTLRPVDFSCPFHPSTPRPFDRVKWSNHRDAVTTPTHARRLQSLPSLSMSMATRLSSPRSTASLMRRAVFPARTLISFLVILTLSFLFRHGF